jgi:hypothetical protein
VSTPEYVVVWPLRRDHYLFEVADMMSTATPVVDETSLSLETHSASSAPPIASPGRELAARALAAACTQQRVGELLGVSRRTIARRPDFDVPAALHDEGALTLARAELANTEHRGSTAEERAAAEAWLERAQGDDQLAHGTNGAAPSHGAATPIPGRTVTGRKVNGRAATRAIRRGQRGRSHRLNAPAMLSTTCPLPSAA